MTIAGLSFDDVHIFILLNTGNGSITDIQFNNIDYCYVHNKDTN